MNKVLVVIATGILSIFSLKAQETNKKPWKNHKCAVVLTYDDGLDTHLDNVVPSLDSAGFKGTFYVPGHSWSLYARLEDWRKAAKKGHELGNHTIFHPCSKTPNGRDWVNDDDNLDSYSLNRIKKEIRVMNTMLKAIDGKTERTFAYTCGDMDINGESFIDYVQKNFAGARGTARDFRTIEKTDLYNTGAFMVNSQPVEELTDVVKKAMKENTLVVFLFHGVGGNYAIDYPLEKHNALVRFLKQNKKDIWVAPMVEVDRYINNYSKMLSKQE